MAESPAEPDMELDFEELGRLYLSIEEKLEPGAQVLDRTDEITSRWSALQHLAHLALANELAFQNVKNLLSGKGRLIQPEGEPTAAARQVLRDGVLPKGASAPRMVRPPEQVQWNYLVEWIEGNRADIALLEHQTEAIAKAPGRIPHQLMGPLRASYWVRFAAMHTAHHLTILNAVLRAAPTRA